MALDQASGSDASEGVQCFIDSGRHADVGDMGMGRDSGVVGDSGGPVAAYEVTSGWTRR